ncbi:hypothetical protein BCR34DRAFT_327148 [Clohesyomyces aquaticus]|uniref:Uncharacterized protein n=1 Tax=Clohesyomyces aquaticus TaxID=1231657 RepID=A0A1Y1ZM37_9PLEO|nr:hypothetical protein BCR34DRAFT_327148 [Clohesyomyces aquaticus]
MKLFNLLGTTTVAALITLTFICAQGVLVPWIPSQYYLRVNAGKTQWHHQPLSQLPKSKLLGLENITREHPVPTPPLNFLPIDIPGTDSRFAMQVPYSGDDLSKTPYITAVSWKGSSTAAMKVLFMSDPTEESVKEGCPVGNVVCVADAWSTSGRNEEGVRKRLEYGGWQGAWGVFADAGVRGGMCSGLEKERQRR